MKAMKKIISILSWVLSVIAIIAAVAVFVYVGNEKENYNTDAEDAVVAELQENIVSLQSTIDSLRHEFDIKYDDNSKRYQMEYKAEQLEWMIDAMPADNPNAIDIIAYNLFDIGRSLIEYMGDAEFRAHNFVDPEVEVTKNGYTYSKCDISYSDAEKFYSQVFTENALKNFMSIRFTDIDGDLYAIPGGGSSGFGTENIKLTRVGETKDEMKYKVSYVHTFNGGYEHSETCSMTIKSVNGRWRISEIDYIEGYWLSEELYWKARTE